MKLEALERIEVRIIAQEVQNDRIEAKLDALLERKKPKKSLLNEWIPPVYIDSEIWQAFLKHRKEKGQSLKEESYKWCLREMDKINKAGHDVNEALTKSIANGYTGIFAPRTDNTKNEKPEVFSQSHSKEGNAQNISDLDPVDPYADQREQ